MRLKTAVLDADIKVAFEQLARPGVKLSGVLDFIGVRLTDARTQELLEFEGLNVQLADVRPLGQLVKIASVAFTGPRLAVTRDKAGLINLLLLKPTAGDAKSSAASQPGTSGSGRSARAASGPPRGSLDSLTTGANWACCRWRRKAKWWQRRFRCTRLSLILATH